MNRKNSDMPPTRSPHTVCVGQGSVTPRSVKPTSREVQGARRRAPDRGNALGGTGTLDWKNGLTAPLAGARKDQRSKEEWESKAPVVVGFWIQNTDPLPILVHKKKLQSAIPDHFPRALC